LKYLARPKLKRHYPQSLQHSKLKTEGTTPISSFKARHEDLKIPSSYTKEETTPSQQKLPAKPQLLKTSIASEELSNSHRILSDIQGSLTPLTLRVSRCGFDKRLLATSTLQPSTLATEDDLHLRQKKVFDATQSITGELEEQPLRPNSNLVSAPLTTTLRNLGTRFCLRGEEL
jgi:hypothetical protein